MDINQLTQIIEAAIALVLAVLAWWKSQQVKTLVTPDTAATVPAVVKAAVVNGLPERSWKMNDATKRWLTFDATPENKAIILAQIDAAEAAQEIEYTIDYEGGYYLIRYGSVYGGGGNPSGQDADYVPKPPATPPPVTPATPPPVGCK